MDTRVASPLYRFALNTHVVGTRGVGTDTANNVRVGYGTGVFYEYIERNLSFELQAGNHMRDSRREITCENPFQACQLFKLATFTTPQAVLERSDGEVLSTVMDGHRCTELGACSRCQGIWEARDIFLQRISYCGSTHLKS